jgi:hypothetical protein
MTTSAPPLRTFEFGQLLIQADRDATHAEYSSWEPGDAVLFTLSEFPDLVPSLPPELLECLAQIGVDPLKPSAVRVGAASSVARLEWVSFGPPWWPDDDYPAYSADIAGETRVTICADGIAARPGFALRQRWTIAAEVRR